MTNMQGNLKNYSRVQVLESIVPRTCKAVGCKQLKWNMQHVIRSSSWRTRAGKIARRCKGPNVGEDDAT